jgi:hypothetical protein
MTAGYGERQKRDGDEAMAHAGFAEVRETCPAPMWPDQSISTSLSCRLLRSSPLATEPRSDGASLLSLELSIEPSLGEAPLTFDRAR